MSRAKIEIISEENIGLYADFGSESEDDGLDEFERIRKYFEDTKDFIKCHPMPSHKSKKGTTFWTKVIDRLKNTKGVNATIIDSLVRYNMTKRCMKTSRIKKSSLIVERNSIVMENSTLWLSI